jgi:hypothetical protein
MSEFVSVWYCYSISLRFFYDNGFLDSFDRESIACARATMLEF